MGAPNPKFPALMAFLHVLPVQRELGQEVLFNHFNGQSLRLAERRGFIEIDRRDQHATRLQDAANLVAHGREVHDMVDGVYRDHDVNLIGLQRDLGFGRFHIFHVVFLDTELSVLINQHVDADATACALRPAETATWTTAEIGNHLAIDERGIGQGGRLFDDHLLVKGVGQVRTFKHHPGFPEPVFRGVLEFLGHEPARNSGGHKLDGGDQDAFHDVKR